MTVLRRAFGSSTRTWMSGWAVGAALVAATALIEALFMRDDTWQYLASFLLGYFIVMAWLVAGAVLGVAALLRPRVPAVELIVHVLLGTVIVVAVVLWAWAAIAAVAAHPY